MKKIQEARRRSDRVRGLLEMLGDDRKNPPAGHALRGFFYSSTRPLPSRRGFACGVAERNDRMGGSAGQGLSHRASAVESRDRRLEFPSCYEGFKTSSAHFLVCANRHFTRFGMMG